MAIVEHQLWSVLPDIRVWGSKVVIFWISLVERINCSNEASWALAVIIGSPDMHSLANLALLHHGVFYQETLLVQILFLHCWKVLLERTLHRICIRLDYWRQFPTLNFFTLFYHNLLKVYLVFCNVRLWALVQVKSFDTCIISSASVNLELWTLFGTRVENMLFFRGCNWTLRFWV